MANRKTAKAPEKEQKRGDTSVSARIDRLVDYENSKVKAIASVNIRGAFAVHGLRVIDSQKGLFVQMPQSSYVKNGDTAYSDIFHPVTAASRNELINSVLKAYDKKLAEVQTSKETEDTVGEDCGNENLDEQDEDTEFFEQSM